ncbi:hypothetical protein K1T71_005806 [Dendrolimus kikuchii]|uniref:Uncharacterized protein n=1 Tax=Dendrolimus kikuchii TaxID=765133 RepID=A0ACC1D5E2_9NEOP|nr:hypothetical protein K1T71_005806 [Dendrolimus kikuchii]
MTEATRPEPINSWTNATQTAKPKFTNTTMDTASIIPSVSTTIATVMTPTTPQLTGGTTSMAETMILLIVLCALCGIILIVFVAKIIYKNNRSRTFAISATVV